MTDRTVYIHTNAKQLIGALVAEYALRRNSADAGRFATGILIAEEFPFLRSYEGRHYLREGRRTVWRNDDLQSFVPLRFAVPAQQHYAGRAVVVDPDVFAVGDVNELLDMDMGGHALLARRMPPNGRRALRHASSVMLLDCARLRHWDVERDFAKVFEDRVDYRDWVWLANEPDGSVGPLPACWNDFDHLGPETRLLHNTHRRTQPWKTGLRADFTPRGTTFGRRAAIAGRKVWSFLSGASASGYYRPHPDRAQERLFFRLLGECLERGIVRPILLEREIAREHVRRDAFRLVHEARLGTA